MKKAIKIFIILLMVIIVFSFGFILTLHLFEYKPADTTALDIQRSDEINQNVSLNNPIKIITFNTGYASLSQSEDFVMDGGSKAKMDSKEEVQANINGIQSILMNEAADIYLLQEVDTDSKRSYEINQYDIYDDTLEYASAFAYNYRSIFVPFPLNPSQMMGKVNSGIVTFSSYNITEATRVQLPGSFPWPVRLANLKRALLVTRHPIQDSEKELVIINVHLSAYDDGSMRIDELDALQEIILQEKNQGHFVLVGGDFNQSFPSALLSYEDQETYTYKELYALNQDDFWEAYPLNPDWYDEHQFQLIADALVPTCRLLHQPYDTEVLDNNQYYLIDGFIASDNIDVISYRTLDEHFLYSDHNPVEIIIQLNQ